MGDRYGYIGIETLLNFCENSKDHSITPNDFMRMERVREPKPKTGEWIDEKINEYMSRTYCSVCKGYAPFICVTDDFYGNRMHGETRKTRHCPHCGSLLLGGEENG